MMKTGTGYILDDVLNQPNGYWKSAAACELLIPVSWKFQRDLKNMGLVGHWKPFSSMPMNGSPERKVPTVPTPTPIVQGFFALLLNKVERDRVLACCRHLKRYLLPYEAAKILKKDLTFEITELKFSAMQQEWVDFCKAQDLDQAHGSIVDPEVLALWFDWVTTHYTDP